MKGEGRTIHPYDLLASPKRRKIIRALENGPLTYSDIMDQAGIDDSGKLSYHLGILSHYIDHKDNLYSLSFEGKVLSRAAKEFESKTYGVSVQGLFSGAVDETGYLRLNNTLGISIVIPTGEIRKWDPQTIDQGKIGTAVRSLMEGQLRQSNLGDLSVDFEENRMIISYEMGTQAYQERDGWLVGKTGNNLLSEATEQEKAWPFPGMHTRTAGTILFPQGAEIQVDFPERKTLEDLGLEIYEFSQDGLNLRWKVRKEDMLYLGETRIEGPDRPRAIVESEFHVSSTRQTETWGEMRKGILDLPKLLSGETRFRVDR